MLYQDLPPKKRGTQHHICLFVPDIEKSGCRAASRCPARKDYKGTFEIKTGVNRKRQRNVWDPDGMRVELMEPQTIDGKPTPPSKALPPR